MPRRDGTGPMGMGRVTGRGMGFCNVTRAEGAIRGLGLGFRRVFGGIGFNDTINPEDEKDLLKEQKAILENRLDLLNNQLNTLQDDK